MKVQLNNLPVSVCTWTATFCHLASAPWLQAKGCVKPAAAQGSGSCARVVWTRGLCSVWGSALAEAGCSRGAGWRSFPSGSVTGSARYLPSRERDGNSELFSVFPWSGWGVNLLFLGVGGSSFYKGTLLSCDSGLSGLEFRPFPTEVLTVPVVCCGEKRCVLGTSQK